MHKSTKPSRMPASSEVKTVWLTGLSGAGKSTLAVALKNRLAESATRCVVLDGDILRSGLCADLGFSPKDRSENIRRVAHLCKLFNNEGLHVIVALISPYAQDRLLARHIIGGKAFLEIHVATSLAECERRDVKGLYAKARKGEIGQFTGVSAPYEAPTQADCVLDTAQLSVTQCVDSLHAMIQGRPPQALRAAS